MFDNPIYNRDGSEDVRIICRAHADADEMKEVTADDIAGRMSAATVGDLDFRRVRGGYGVGLLRVCRSDAEIMAGHAFDQFPAACDHPILQVG